jgi:hypothetical protein
MRFCCDRGYTINTLQALITTPPHEASASTLGCCRLAAAAWLLPLGCCRLAAAVCCAARLARRHMHFATNAHKSRLALDHQKKRGTGSAHTKKPRHMVQARAHIGAPTEHPPHRQENACENTAPKHANAGPDLEVFDKHSIQALVSDSTGTHGCACSSAFVFRILN